MYEIPFWCSSLCSWIHFATETGFYHLSLTWLSSFTLPLTAHSRAGQNFFERNDLTFLHFLFPLLLPYNNLVHMFLLYPTEFWPLLSFCMWSWFTVIFLIIHSYTLSCLFQICDEMSKKFSAWHRTRSKLWCSVPPLPKRSVLSARSLCKM